MFDEVKRKVLLTDAVLNDSEPFGLRQLLSQPEQP